MAFLYEELHKDAHLAQNLALLDLANLLATLEYLAGVESPARVIDVATTLEGLIHNLNRPKALARVVEIRTAAARRLSGWSNARFEAERAGVERLMEQGRHEEAVQAARSLHQKTQVAGETAYDGAAYDNAMAQFTLGRALRLSGSAEDAMTHLEEARRRFERAGASQMANTGLGDKADCLRDLGRYDEAASAYGDSIRDSEQLGDRRAAAVGRGQLATVRTYQKRYGEALELHTNARETFQKLGEPRHFAVAGHQIGRVHEETGQ